MQRLPVYKASCEQKGDPPCSEESVGHVPGTGISVVFLVVVALFFLYGKSASDDAARFTGIVSLYFVSILLEALPFMLLGTLVGGLLEIFVPAGAVDRLFGRHRYRAVFLAGGLGLFFPTCECAIVPIVRRLIIKGVPVPAAICFMLSGPIVNLIVAWSTAVAYTWNWKVVCLRMGCGYLVAVGIGLLLCLCREDDGLVLPGLARRETPLSCGCGCEDDLQWRLPVRLYQALKHARDDFLAVGKYLVIGTFITALLRTSVPLNHFDSLASSPWLAILIMMVMAVVMNLCSEADAFIAASFRWILPGSAQLGFLVLGPMLDLKLMLMYLSVFRKRTILFLIVSTFSLVYLLMLLIDRFLPVFV